MLDSRAEYEWMARAEESLWWYRSVHTLATNALATHPAGSNLRILDAGCGTGGLMRFLARSGYRNVEGIDLSPLAIEICRARGLNVRLADLQNLPSVESQWDAVLCIDSLSYIPRENCARVVQALAEQIKPGGLFITNLPAFACFGGRHDREVGTVRRFHPRELRALMQGAGLKILHARCWPFLLAPAILAARFADRAAAQLGYRGIRAEARIPRRWINECLLGLVQWELRCIPDPGFGSSIFAIAQK